MILLKKITKLILFCTLGLFITQCASDGDSFAAAESDTGVGGSYARFIISGNFLYVIDDQRIKTYDLTDPVVPAQIDIKDVGSNIESLFRLDKRLFIGSGSGLYIYEIDDQGIPQPLGLANYQLPFEPCDPVVADTQYAYVTLNTLESVSSCGRSFIQEVNVLKIFDLTQIESPELVAEYEMFAPKGVGIDGDILFLCDDIEGLKIFNVADPREIQIIAQFDNFTAFDVIPLNGLLLVVATDNIYQFDYTDLNNIRLISNIPIEA